MPAPRIRDRARLRYFDLALDLRAGIVPSLSIRLSLPISDPSGHSSRLSQIYPVTGRERKRGKVTDIGAHRCSKRRTRL